MGLSPEAWERSEKEKITTSAVCGLFVKVAELNSISQSLGEKIKIYVRAKMCFEAFLLLAFALLTLKQAHK